MNLNQIKAARQVVFSTVKKYIGVHKLTVPIKGYEVDMFAVAEFYCERAKAESNCWTSVKSYGEDWRQTILG